MKPQDGRLRYWMFINGEQARLFSALAAGFSAVTWCFLYVLGAGTSIVGITLIALTCVGFVAWRLLDGQMKEYERDGWGKDRRSRRVEKTELWVAVGLWL